MVKPKDKKQKQINLLLPAALYTEMKKTADSIYLSVSDFVRQAVVEKINKIEKERRE